MIGNVKIEFSAPADANRWLAWRMEVLREVYGIPPGTDVSDLRRANISYFRAAMASGTHISLHATVGGSRVGVADAVMQRELPAPDNPTGRSAYIMNVYVREEWRGHGIGREMVDCLIEEAVLRGASKIYLESTETGRPFYESLGFRDMKDMMALPQARLRGECKNRMPRVLAGLI